MVFLLCAFVSHLEVETRNIVKFKNLSNVDSFLQGLLFLITLTNGCGCTVMVGGHPGDVVEFLTFKEMQYCLHFR